ncbi:MAG: aldehyde dehydrogenase, partial [Thermoleophilaceae bacterium]|nr:aldehyde dehydrogenase [Thermoleophilaceae bacterium]
MATETQAPAQPGHDSEVIVRDRFFIGGEWVEPAGGGGVIEVIDSTTEQVMGRVAEGTAADVDRAVVAARAAFEVWSQVPIGDRAEACRGIAQALAQRGPEIAALISR